MILAPVRLLRQPTLPEGQPYRPPPQVAANMSMAADALRALMNQRGPWGGALGEHWLAGTGQGMQRIETGGRRDPYRPRAGQGTCDGHLGTSR